MKIYIKFIKRFYLPLIALSFLGLIYFGVNGVKAELLTEKEKPQESNLAERPLNIVAVDNIQTQDVVSPTPLETKTAVKVSATPEVKNIPATEIETLKIKVTTRINAGGAAGNYVVDFKENESAFDLLSRIAKVDYDTYPEWGAFVKAIGGLYNKGDSAWFFYVNGISSSEGSSLYIIKPNDLIEWRYHEYWIY